MSQYATIPDTAPVITVLQALLLQGIRHHPTGLDPTTGFSCWGFVRFAFGMAGVALPEDPVEATALFDHTNPPYQPWDVLLCHSAHFLEPRHLLLLLTPTEGFHCGHNTNGLARFDLTRPVWRRLIAHGWRYRGWACA